MNAASFFQKYKLEVCIFALALVVRLLFFGLSYSANHGNLIGVINGGDDYFELSQNIVAGHGYSPAKMPPYIPSVFRTPGMPYFIALLYVLSGSYAVVIFLHMLISSLIPVLGMRLSRYLTGMRNIPLYTGLFLALEPSAALLGTELLSDTLFTFFFCLSLLTLFRYFKDKDPHELIASGLFLGTATLVRPPALYLSVCFAAFVLMQARAHFSRTILIRVGAFILAFLVVLSPWLYRNYRTFGVVGLSSQQGAALYGVVVPSVLSIAHHSDFAKEQPAGTDALGNTTFEQSAQYTKNAVSILTQYPKAVVLFSLNMMVSFFIFDGTYDVLHRLDMNGDMYSIMTSAKAASGIPVNASTLLVIKSSPLAVIHFLFALAKTSVVFLLIGRVLWLFITLLFIIGVWHALRKSQRTIYTMTAVFVIAFFMLITMAAAFNISARYRLPVEPLIAAFALCGLSLAATWCMKKLVRSARH